ncbi:MAG: hypothetical protein JO092_04985 [Candidatus Eremiobacteraeota bacterium]|nr:hypothetical protein [Candidatus Eremiobacteraeota bacterium]
MRLGAAHSFAVVSFDDWRHLWQNNPLWERLGKEWPIGWVLQAPTGEIVGSFANVPSLYELGGQSLVCANSRAWVVAEAYRGYALWLLDEYFNQQGADLCLSTTAGPLVQEALTELSARIPLGQWDTFSYWVTGHRALAREALKRRGVPFASLLAIAGAAPLRLRDAFHNKPLSKGGTSVAVEFTDGFDSRFDAFWLELRRQNQEKLLAERSRKALSWHFSLPLRERRLWILTASRDARILAYCICKQQPRSPLRAMRLADYQSLEPEVDHLPFLLAAALRRCRSSGIGVFENHGRGVPKMRTLDRCAPYHRQLGYWPFFYYTANPQLGAELSQSPRWDPSDFDGDASLE